MPIMELLPSSSRQHRANLPVRGSIPPPEGTSIPAPTAVCITIFFDDAALFRVGPPPTRRIPGLGWLHEMGASAGCCNSRGSSSGSISNQSPCTRYTYMVLCIPALYWEAVASLATARDSSTAGEREKNGGKPAAHQVDLTSEAGNPSCCLF
ncbi:hypothetical protein LZ30DRAFT_419261 [Colletotrichum cereale]|nr:hypothetical protein LZ30DRAFT_419261 [Colletotrichum cereale]